MPACSWLTPLLMLAVLACSERGSDAGPQPDERPEELPERRIVNVDWHTVFENGGPQDDTLLESTSRVAASPGGIYVLDMYAKRLHRFTPDGRRAWAVGREGSGPDELRAPRDIDLDPGGRIWILDVENLRALIVDTLGSIVGRVPLAGIGRSFDVFSPVSESTAIVVSHDVAAPLVRVDTAGRILARDTFPWSGFARLDPMAAQVQTRADPARRRWAAAFAFGDGFFTFDSAGATRGWFAEPIPFPTVRHERNGATTISAVQHPVFAAISVALADSALYVLFSGRTAHAGRIVDCFDAATGAYRSSFLLPRVVNDFAVVGDVIYGTYSAPFPAVAAWRPADGTPLPCR